MNDPARALVTQRANARKSLVTRAEASLSQLAAMPTTVMRERFGWLHGSPEERAMIACRAIRDAVTPAQIAQATAMCCEVADGGKR